MSWQTTALIVVGVLLGGWLLMTTVGWLLWTHAVPVVWLARPELGWFQMSVVVLCLAYVGIFFGGCRT